jgi:hypothetical protein
MLWRSNVPDLHVHIDRSQKSQWFEWGMQLQKRTSLWCSALALVDPRGKLVRQLAPPGADYTDPDVIKRAYADAARRLRAGWTDQETHFSSENQRARIMGTRYDPKAILDGTAISVWSSGKVHFLWQPPNGEVIAYTLNGSRTWMPNDRTETRWLKFSNDGISILDDHSEVLFRREYDNQVVTWTTLQLSKSPQADELRMLWEHHVPEGNWHFVEAPVEEESDDALPAEFYLPLGQKPLRNRQVQQLELYSTPPRPGEGTWIINEFLNDLFGMEGGRLFNGVAHNFPENAGEHVKLLLQRFVGQPIYANYPWKQDWLDILADPGKNGAATIRRNVDFCRGPITDVSGNKSGGIGSHGKYVTLSGKWWVVTARRQGW